MRILVIGDSHCAPGQDLRRFKALGKYIVDECPDVVVSIGDFLTLDSLSDWDKSKRGKMEGRRYKADISAANRALDLTQLSTDPRYIYIMGNHEYRLPRYLDYDPTMMGFADIENDLSLATRKWKVVDYKDDIRLSGISFTHIPINGMGRPIGNPHVVEKALALYSTSVVFGHCHVLSHAAEHRKGAPHLNQALCCGCFFEHVDEYAIGSKTDYWRGLVMIDAYGNNRFDFSTIALSKLLKRYGL